MLRTWNKARPDAASMGAGSSSMGMPAATAAAAEKTISSRAPQVVAKAEPSRPAAARTRSLHARAAKPALLEHACCVRLLFRLLFCADAHRRSLLTAGQASDIVSMANSPVSPPSLLCLFDKCTLTRAGAETQVLECAWLWGFPASQLLALSNLTRQTAGRPSFCCPACALDGHISSQSC